MLHPKFETVTEYVLWLEKTAESLLESYRHDLETSLGIPFTVNKLSWYEWGCEPENQFYSVQLEGNDFGTIFPNLKKAFIKYHNIFDKSKIQIADKTLTKKGYEIKYQEESNSKLVEILKERKNIE